MRSPFSAEIDYSDSYLQNSVFGKVGTMFLDSEYSVHISNTSTSRLFGLMTYGLYFYLNGTTTSANELLTWAQGKYTNLVEQAVWVQFSSDNKVDADYAFLPLAEALPRLQIRIADFTFRCPKIPTPR